MSFYSFLRPILFRLPPEIAHMITLRALQWGDLVLPAPRPDDYALRVKVMGLDFSNPFGLAAGFDKDALAISGVLKIGFAYAEIGTITPLPQAGQSRPRLFRLPAADALINRMGFNSRGQDYAARRLAVFRNRSVQWLNYYRPRLVGANIGANKESAERIADYVTAAHRFAPLADYLTLNISSPNTPRLRELQKADAVGGLMATIREAVPDTPIVVKIAPDLDTEAACALAQLAIKQGIDGLVIGNTTTSRAGVEHLPQATEAGGLSGAPLFAASTALLSEVYRATGGKLVLIGTGGISTPAQAYAKIRAGASLLQLYTGLVYHGPALLKDLKGGLVRLLHRDGFATIGDAVGADHKTHL